MTSKLIAMTRESDNWLVRGFDGIACDSFSLGRRAAASLRPSGSRENEQAFGTAAFGPQGVRGTSRTRGVLTMKRLAALHVGLVGLALAAFSGHALAATSCNTGPAGPLGPNPALSGTVTGGVVVHEGAFCVIDGANISGGLRVTEGGIVFVCASTINGGVRAEEASEIVFGAEEIVGCGGNLINGGVKISETGPGILPPPGPSIALEHTTINGSVHLSENSGPIAVASNTIVGGLFCHENKFDLEDEGSPSIITGKVTCKFAD